MSSKNRKNYRGIKCLNCEYPLDISDKYCCNCGQKNNTKRLSLKDFFSEFLSNFYAYDSKVLNSIKALFTAPGRASKEYVLGKRTNYANPFRFYLSVSILFFIVENISTKFQGDFKNPNQKIETYVEVDSLKNQTVDSLSIGVDSTKAPLKKDTKYTSLEKLNSKGFLSRTVTKINDYQNFYEENQSLSIDSSLTVLAHEKTNWNRYLFKKAIDTNMVFGDHKDSSENGFKDFVLSKLPLILFISLPFLTLCFSLVYIRSKLNYAEHLVFVFNVMTFIFLLLFLEKIFVFIGFNGFAFFISLGLPLYIYKSLRNFYHQSRWKTIIKFVILTFILPIMAAFVAVMIFFILFILF